MKAYKGFKKTADGKLMCRDMEYEVGRKYVLEGEVKICKSGYHACHNLWDVFKYYPNNGENMYYEVECGGEIIEPDWGEGLFVCSEIELVKEADMGVWADVMNVYLIGMCDKSVLIVKDVNLKFNVVVDKARLLFDEWQENVMYESNNVVVTADDKKYSVHNIDGERLFEDLESFGTVYLCKGDRRAFEIRKEGKTNWLYDDGTLFSDVWFDRVYYEYENMVSHPHAITSCIAEVGGCIWRLDLKDKSIDIIFGSPCDKKMDPMRDFIPADCMEVSVGDVIRFPEEKEEVLCEVVNVAEMLRPVVGVIVKYTKGRNGMTKLRENEVYENVTTGKMIRGFHFNSGWCK